MSEMAPEGLPDEGESVDVQAEGCFDTDSQIFTITWGIPGSIVVTAHYKLGEEPLISAMLAVAQQSWENVHEATLEAIEQKMIRKDPEEDSGA